MKEPRIQAKSCPSNTYDRYTHMGKIYITVVWDDEGPDALSIAVLGRVSKSNPCLGSEVEAIGRLASIAMRYGAPIEAVAHQLFGITCEPYWNNGVQIKSVADAFASVLNQAYQDGPPDMTGVPR